MGRRRRGPTRPRPWARLGDDSDCFYCGDFDSEEEIAHYLDLDDELGITKSWALVLEVCERHALARAARGARARGFYFPTDGFVQLRAAALKTINKYYLFNFLWARLYVR